MLRCARYARKSSAIIYYYRFPPWPVLTALNNNNNNNKTVLERLMYSQRNFRDLTLGESLTMISIVLVTFQKQRSILFYIYVRQNIFLMNRSREPSHKLITELPRTRFDHIPRYRFSFYSLWVIDLKPKYHNKSAEWWSACKKKLFKRPFARLRHFTTTTRILFVLVFIFQFGSPSEVEITKALICTRKQNPERFWS